MNEFLKKIPPGVVSFGVYGFFRSIVFLLPFVVRTFKGKALFIYYEHQYAISLQIGSLMMFGVLNSYPSYVIKKNGRSDDSKKYLFFISGITLVLSIVLRIFHSIELGAELLMIAIVVILTYYSTHNKVMGRPQLSQLLDVLLPIIIVLIVAYNIFYILALLILMPIILNSIGTFNVLFICRHWRVFVFAFIIQLIPQLIRILAPFLNSEAEIDRIFLLLRIFSVGILFHQYIVNYFFRNILEKYAVLDYFKISVSSSLIGCLFFVLSKYTFLNTYLLGNTIFSISEIGILVVYIFFWSLLSLFELKVHFLELQEKVFKSVFTYLSMGAALATFFISGSLIFGTVVLMIVFTLNLYYILNEDIASK